MISDINSKSIKDIKEEFNIEIEKFKNMHKKYKRAQKQLLKLIEVQSSALALNENLNIKTSNLYNNITQYLATICNNMALIKKFIKKTSLFLANIRCKDVDLYKSINTYNNFENKFFLKLSSDFFRISTFLNESPISIYEFKKRKNKMPQNKTALNNKYQENTLVISEKEKKITLPYYKKDIINYIKNNNLSDTTINDVICQNYTIPLSNYSNFIKSRFCEAYKLIRLKEHGSIKEALDLASELAFNFKLHPAIITACKNIKELDIYLACLEYNELKSFKYFNIVFELSPKIKK